MLFKVLKKLRSAALNEKRKIELFRKNGIFPKKSEEKRKNNTTHSLLPRQNDHVIEGVPYNICN